MDRSYLTYWILATHYMELNGPVRYPPLGVRSEGKLKVDIGSRPKDTEVLVEIEGSRVTIYDRVTYPYFEYRLEVSANPSLTHDSNIEVTSNPSSSGRKK